LQSLFLDRFRNVAQQGSNMYEVVGNISALATLDRLHEINVIAQPPNIPTYRLPGHVMDFLRRTVPVVVALNPQS
jgi:hypothetical protein